MTPASPPPSTHPDPARPLDAVSRFLHAKVLRRLRRHLHPAESVQAVTPGRRKGRPGHLVVTDRRMAWVPKGRFARIEMHPRGPLHEDRRGDTTRLIDRNAPSWQVEGAPAARARSAAKASDPPPPDAPRRRRADELLARGLITKAEHEWMTAKDP